MTELDYILQNFDERFRRFKGRRIALYPGKYLDAIVRRFDSDYHFHCILKPGASEAPKDAELALLTDCRREDEPDYNAVCESCEKQGTPLFDIFGVDLLETHRELTEQKHLTISQWKEALAEYDVISIAIPYVATDCLKAWNRWTIRRRFLILHEWLKKQGKELYFLWDKEEQAAPLKLAGIDLDGRLFQRTESDLYFCRLAEQNPGKKIIHIGVDTARDGIIPRDYRIDSRLLRFFVFQNYVSTAGEVVDASVDRKELLEAIDRHDVVSFDIFDTLLKRLVLYPKDVFEIVEEQTGVKGFADFRYHVQTTRPQLSLDGFYRWLKENCGYDDQTAETLRRTELKIESDVIVPRDSMVEVFEYAKERNKTIALVSDMYLDQDFIRTLLEKHGITGYHELYLSHEFHKLKQDGLFEELLKSRKDGETVLHIGDNRYSDYTIAIKYGLDVFYVPSCLDAAKQSGFAEIIEASRSLAERKTLGLSVALGFDNPFESNDDIQIANMIVAPLMLGYLLWVCGELRGKEYDYFLLVSRDGWILLEAYNRLRQKFQNLLPPGKYFYMNRHAVFLTVMDDFNVGKYFFYIYNYKNDPPKLLRQVFSVPAGKLLPYQGESVDDYYQKNIPTLHELAEQYRKNYRRYLERERLAGKKCALMDFVSEGGSLMMLGKHIAKFDGYYVGIPEYVSKYSENVRYFFDHDLMNYDTELKLEAYFTSPEPAVNYIGDDGIPVFAKEIRPQKTLDRIQKIHDLISRYLTIYIDRLHELGDALDKEFVFNLCALINRYGVDNFYFDDMTAQEIPSGS